MMSHHRLRLIGHWHQMTLKCIILLSIKTCAKARYVVALAAEINFSTKVTTRAWYTYCHRAETPEASTGDIINMTHKNAC